MRVSKFYTGIYLFIERCSLSLTVPVDNINSYIYMNFVNITMCIGSLLLMVLTESLLNNVSPKYIENPYRWFCWCRKVLILLVGSSICNQMVSATACRPIEILYDLRYIAMIMTQLVGFFICLIFAFFLGIKFASIKAIHRLSTP
jgi:hypothetical protein